MKAVSRRLRIARRNYSVENRCSSLPRKSARFELFELAEILGGVRQMVTEPLRCSAGSPLENVGQLCNYRRLAPKHESYIDHNADEHGAQQFDEGIQDNRAKQEVSPCFGGGRDFWETEHN